MKKWFILCFACALLTLLFVSCGSAHITLDYVVDDEVYASVSLDEGEALERLNRIPTKEGYFFGGWFYDYGKWELPLDVGDLNNHLDKSAHYKVYAKWEVVELTLSLETGNRGYIVTELLAGAGSEVVIPSHYENLPVIAIGPAVFRGRTDLTSITIPDTVKVIGDYAFEGCTALTSLTMPHSIVTTGTGAFSGCTSLSDIRFSERLETLGARTFAGCTALTEITLPASVKTIGGSAFAGCTSLTAITLSKSLDKIGPRAFSGCTGLTSLAIPDRVTEIEEYAFENCTGLTAITFGEKSSLVDLCRGAFAGTSIETLYFHETASMAIIRDGAFSGMTALRTLTLPHADLIGSGILEGTPLTVIHFHGTVEEWESIRKLGGWESNTLGAIASVVCSDGTAEITAPAE